MVASGAWLGASTAKSSAAWPEVTCERLMYAAPVSEIESPTVSMPEASRIPLVQITTLPFSSKALVVA